MLEFFKLKSTFCKLTLTLYVDLHAKTADALVTYDRRIVDNLPVAFHEVDSLAKAEAWMKKDQGERGTRVEALEWYHRTFTRAA